MNFFKALATTRSLDPAGEVLGAGLFWHHRWITSCVWQQSAPSREIISFWSEDSSAYGR